MKFSKAQIQKARDKVSADWAQRTRDTYENDFYPPNTSQETKDHNLNAGLKFSEQIKEGFHDENPVIWAKIYSELIHEV